MARGPGHRRGGGRQALRSVSYYCCCWCYTFYPHYCLHLNYFNYFSYYEGIFYYGRYG